MTFKPMDEQPRIPGIELSPAGTTVAGARDPLDRES
jgi:hypothetical protein